MAGDPRPDRPPADPVGRMVASALGEILAGATVEVSYEPAEPGIEGPWATATGDESELDAFAAGEAEAEAGTAKASVAGPYGWRTTVTVRLNDRIARLVGPVGRRTSLATLLHALPRAGVATLAQFRHLDRTEPTASVSPALRRAVRDTLAAEILVRSLTTRLARPARANLVAETIEFLIELSGARVEAHDLTHGVIVADVVGDEPRLEFAYPGDVRAAKRAPLLFDGRRSVLVVDPRGRARTELQRHRFERLVPGAGAQARDDAFLESGSLVAEATRVVGGLGFYVRADRSIWTFVDGRPLLVRRGEHWTAFPLQLTASIENMIGGGSVAQLVARAAFMISTDAGGAILAVVDDPAKLDDVVSDKDRYDLRNAIDPAAMRPETRLHHLIDAEDLDEHTLVRLATLDGATILDRDGRLLAYGAIVTTGDSQHEGARTSAARTLSETADVVLKISVDGDITIFRGGAVVTTLLGRTPQASL